MAAETTDAEMRLRMEHLAQSFPSLRRAVGIAPWDALLFESWAAGPAPGSGALHAARFMLSVWDSSHAWASGPFSFVDAWAAWDDKHRDALLRWAADPWWP